MPISTPTLNPHPFPSNWGKKRIYVLHALWVILCYYSLDGSPLRGVAMRPPLGGRTRLVIIKEIVERKIRINTPNVLSQQFNRNVFSLALKMSSEMSGDRSAARKLFQTTGPLIAKLCFPYSQSSCEES